MNDKDKKNKSPSILESVGSVASFGLEVALEVATYSLETASCCGEAVCEAIGSIDLDV